MRRAIGILFLVIASWVGAFLSACAPRRASSGTDLGSFRVEGLLEENHCRPGFEPNDPLTFSVQLRREGGSILWRVGDGPPAGGPLREDGSFRLLARTPIEAWPADPANGVVGCALQRIETIHGTLVMESSADAGIAPGAPDAGGVRAISFSADHEIEIAPAGGDCSALLLVHGGSFPALPCTALYRLSAEREVE